MSPSVVAVVAVAGVVVGVLGVLIAVVALVRVNRTIRGLPSQTDDHAAELDKMRGEIDSILVALSETLRHIAVVRYDASGGEGEHNSWSMALLDDAGDGVVLTAVSGPDGTQTAAKNIRGGEADLRLASEEREAVSYAMGVAHQSVEV